MTNDLLNSRSREGQWCESSVFLLPISADHTARNGGINRSDYFFGARPAPPSMSPSSNKPAKPRRPISDEADEYPPPFDYSPRDRIDAEKRKTARFGEDEAGPSRPRRSADKERDVDEMRAKAELDEGLRGKGKGKAVEEVVVEKSNVLMV